MVVEGGWGLMGVRTEEERDERWDVREGKNKTMRGMQREMEKKGTGWKKRQSKKE